MHTQGMKREADSYVTQVHRKGVDDGRAAAAAEIAKLNNDLTTARTVISSLIAELEERGLTRNGVLVLRVAKQFVRNELARTRGES